MSYETEIVVLLGTASQDCAARILAALEALADDNDRAAAFERVSSFKHPYTDSARVLVGKVNYLNQDLFFETLRNAASTPDYPSYYTSLGVLLNGQDDDVPRARTLNNEGTWV